MAGSVHSSTGSDGVVIGFFGDADARSTGHARAFEDEVLALIPRHGGRVLFRGTRQIEEPDTLPAEVHLIWFPSEVALSAYLADDDRAELLARHGEVFRKKVSVRLDVLVGT